jgi:CBS domain-containing protein
VSLVLTFRRSYVTNPRNRYIYCAFVSFVIGVLTWTSDYARQNERNAVNALFEANIPEGKHSNFDIFEKSDKFVALPVYFIIKFITCVLSITMPIPCGIFLPLLAVAGSFGRWYGEIVQLILSSPSEPGLYAVVGAAGLIAGATHTISPCVIIIEITSQANNLMPLMITTLVGYAVAGAFTISIYDMLMDISRLPYLPRVRNSSLYHLRAKDVMHPDVRVLTLESTVSDALSLLTYGKSPYEDSASVPQYPLVESERSMLFLGVVKRDDLERYVASSTRLGRILKLVRQSDAADVAPAPAPTFLTRIVADNLVPHGPPVLRSSASANDIRTGTSGAVGQLSSVAGVAPAAPAMNVNPPLPVTSEAPKSGLLENADCQDVDDEALVASDAVGMTLSRPASGASVASREHEDHKHGAGAEETKFTTPVRATQPRGDSGSEVSDPRLQHVQSMPSLATSIVKRERESHDDWLWAKLPFDLDPDEQLDPEKAVSVDLAPFQVPELTSMPLLHFLFAICMYSRIYVTHHGRLTGVVYKGDFLDEKWLHPSTRR